MMNVRQVLLTRGNQQTVTKPSYNYTMMKTSLEDYMYNNRSNEFADAKVDALFISKTNNEDFFPQVSCFLLVCLNLFVFVVVE